MNTEKTGGSIESEKSVLNGWLMLPVSFGLLIGGVWVIVSAVKNGEGHPSWWLLLAGILTVVAGKLTILGYFTLQPNEARVLLLFGAYRGTVRRSGFHWGNPFYSNGDKTSGLGNRHKVSLRARTLNVEKLKVNDKRGNPIEIAAVVVWRVQDTAQAVFDVDDYENYVQTQSESALRHLASTYDYDDGADNEATLRSSVEEVSQALRGELQQRLAKAGRDGG